MQHIISMDDISILNFIMLMLYNAVIKSDFSHIQVGQTLMACLAFLGSRAGLRDGLRDGGLSAWIPDCSEFWVENSLKNIHEEWYIAIFCVCVFV